ncbi:MAG TPA: hypothetical protein VI259_00905 [Gemmatimonadaceae bacterium]
MAGRTVTDSAGRTWTCVPAMTGSLDEASLMGKDVVLTCSTPSVAEAARITVGWQWETMSSNGLARIIAVASPVPRG